MTNSPGPLPTFEGFLGQRHEASTVHLTDRDKDLIDQFVQGQAMTGRTDLIQIDSTGGQTTLRAGKDLIATRTSAGTVELGPIVVGPNQKIRNNVQKAAKTYKVTLLD